MSEYLSEIVIALIGLISAITVFYKQKTKREAAETIAEDARQMAVAATERTKKAVHRTELLIIQAEKNSKIVETTRRNLDTGKEAYKKLHLMYDKLELELSEAKEIIKNFGKTSVKKRRR